MNRRQALKTVGALAGAAALARFGLLPPSRSAQLAAPNDLAIRFFESLSPGDRTRACVPYDHPLRQYHNRGVWGGGLWINPISLGWEQRRILTDVLHAGLSEAGRARVPHEYFGEWPGVHSMRVLLCGDPRSPPYQLILTGAHLNLRLGGASREGAAFGGPLMYGDQRGNSVPGLPGNVFRFQNDIAQRLFQSLRPEQQRLVLQRTSPIQTDIQLQGSEASFAGLAIGSLSPASRKVVRELIDAILSTYPASDVAYAWQCLDHNGGLERLFLAYYEDSGDDRTNQYPNFRIEGPAAVSYFRGAPHVHAFINIAMNGDAPLSVGESLGENSTLLEGAGVKRLFEAAMREHSGTDLAFYPGDSVAGRLRRGPIRTGDIYALESWQDHVVEVEIKGSNLGPGLVDDLRARGIDPAGSRTYSVATTGFAAEDPRRYLGTVESHRKRGMVRDALIAHLAKRASSALG
jgi:hypothetical protein